LEICETSLQCLNLCMTVPRFQFYGCVSCDLFIALQYIVKIFSIR